MATRNQGIIDPPIDALLDKVDSKYQLVIYASKRARQINDYYSDLHEGNLFDNVGPLVDSTVEDKPLTIALHEIHEDKLRTPSPRVSDLRLFTSESVTEGHPDKICDQISDGILDAILAEDPAGRVAVETLVTTGLVHVAGEVSTSAYVEIPAIVRDVVNRIG